MSSGERRRDLRPCTLMMVQNEHWIRAAAPASKLVTPPAVRRTRSRGKERDRRAFDARQIVHEIVERLELPGGGVAQHLVQPAFGFAGEERNAHRLRRDRRSASLPSSMRDHARDMKAADARPGCRAARSGRAMSSARGNWFDCTPTSITMPAPAASIMLARCGQGGCACWSRRRRGSRSRHRRRARAVRRSRAARP